MIQRIQSLFLLLSGILIGLILIFPFAEVVGKTTEIYQLDIKGLHQIGMHKMEILRINWPLVLVSAITIIVILVTIFKYSNRKLQVRLSILNMFLSIGIFMALYVYVLSAAEVVNGSYSLNILSAFPLFSTVLNFLAIRRIMKDEALVKSVNRIR